MLNYKRNGRKRLGRPLNRLLEESETGLSRSYSWRIMMMMIMMIITILNTVSSDFG